RELGKRARTQGIAQPVLVEVKLDPAETKHGIQSADALDLVETVARTDGLVLRGFMGMAPYGSEPDAARPYFRALRSLFERLPAHHRQTLSMGMSGDFEIAVEEGATIVRVGTAIFGAR